MRFIQKSALTETGDTIVEVLVVIAIISLMLVVSFITANRSLKSVQDAQEHTDAQELITSQIEELRTLSGNVTDSAHNVFTYASGFCIYSDSSSGTPVLTLAPSASSANCKVDGSGKPTTNQPQYTLQITRACSRGCTFTVSASWPSAIGDGINTVSMYYRLYQEAS